MIGRGARGTALFARDSFATVGRITTPRRQRILGVAVLLLGAGLAAACAPSVTRTPPSREADVYAVWGAMVDDLMRGGNARLPVLLDTIAESTGRRSPQEEYVTILRSHGAYFGVTDEMIAAFTSPDSAPVRIDRAMLARRTRVDVAPVDLGRPEMAELRRNGRIGAVSLSRVAFDATRSLALVEGSWVCGGLCGHASTVLMEKDASGRWHVKASLMDLLF